MVVHSQNLLNSVNLILKKAKDGSSVNSVLVASQLMCQTWQNCSFTLGWKKSTTYYKCLAKFGKYRIKKKPNVFEWPTQLALKWESFSIHIFWLHSSNNLGLVHPLSFTLPPTFHEQVFLIEKKRFFFSMVFSPCWRRAIFVSLSEGKDLILVCIISKVIININGHFYVVLQ